MPLFLKMKKSLLLQFLLFTVALTLNSCSNKPLHSFKKAQYNHGHYKAMNNKVKPVEQKKVEIPTIEPAVTASNEIAATTQIPTIENYSQTIEAEREKERISHEPKITTSTEKSFALKGKVKNIFKSPLAPQHKLLKHKKQFSNSEGDARSLLWLLIVILLILWLVGIVAGGWGIGGLIHVLLVIALVLFILWLLRMI